MEELNTTPQFVYLVQGESTNLGRYGHLKHKNSDLILLAYDKVFENSQTESTVLYLPNSTWAEGRNALLEKARQNEHDYLYFIFLDDDVEVVRGSFSQFEKFLLENQPMMGVPLCDQIADTFRYESNTEIHHPVAFDQIVQAYHRDAVQESIAIPYRTELDSESWWYACQINQYLTLRYYRGRCAQLNSFEIRNASHRWSEETESKSQNLIDTSYVSGVTRMGLKACSKIIEDALGPQPKIINSLFHPRYMPKERYGPSLTWIIANYKNLSRTQITRKILSMILAKGTSIIYRLFYRKSLIRFEEFQTIDS